MSESKNIKKFYTEGKTHFITVASWRGEWGLSYEVGVRDMKNGQFDLVASYLSTESQALRIADEVASLLSEKSLDEIKGKYPGFMNYVTKWFCAERTSDEKSGEQ